MKKKFKLILIFLLGGVAIFFQAAPTYGRFYFLDKKLAVDGYFQNQTSYRLGGGDVVSVENIFLIAADYKLSSNLSFYGEWRSLYDAVWDIREDHGKFWNQYEGSEELMEDENKLREMYGVLAWNKLTLRLGLQQIVWGESDGVRLMDIINPLDQRRQFNTRDWRDIRRPLAAVRATYDIDPTRNWFLEFVWTPDFKKDLIDLGDPVNAPGTNYPWSIPLPPTDFTPWGAPVVPNIRECKRTRYSFDSSSYGGRMGYEIGGWFLTLNYFHLFNHNPSTEFHGSTALWMGPGGLQPFPPNGGPPDLILLNLIQRYYSMNIVGFTFNKNLGSLFILRGEFALYPDEPVGSLDTGKHSDMVTRKARLHSMVGFDSKAWMRWLNPEQMISFSGQYFNFWTFDHEWGLVEGPYNQKLNQCTNFVSLKVNTDYSNARISPDCLMVYDITNSGWYMKPRVTFKYGDHWRPEIGAIVFQGHSYRLPFNVLNHKDEFYLQIKYLF